MGDLTDAFLFEGLLSLGDPFPLWLDGADSSPTCAFWASSASTLGVSVGAEISEMMTGWKFTCYQVMWMSALFRTLSVFEGHLLLNFDCYCLGPVTCSFLRHAFLVSNEHRISAVVSNRVADHWNWRLFWSLCVTLFLSISSSCVFFSFFVASKFLMPFSSSFVSSSKCLVPKWHFQTLIFN